MDRELTIACGMYASDDALRQAWRDIFAQFAPRGGEQSGTRFGLEFDRLDAVPAARLWFAHTCGYPLMKSLRPDFVPFCVPVFDLPGCDGKLYSSRIIVAAVSSIRSLAECRGAVAAINEPDSNSGMNLLRYELARSGAEPGFFSGVRYSGGHRASLEAVAAGEAQVAAIDCVSYQLIAERDPGLVARVRPIGFTESSCGLPFVLPRARDSGVQRARLLEALNRALERAAPAAEILHLRAFEAVDLADYDSILELENFSISKGYAEIN